MTDLDLPPRIDTPASWVGHELAECPNDWLYQLTPNDITDLEQAARHFLTLDRDVGEITAETFPLTHFADHMSALREKLLNGVGVEVLSGLPIETYDQKMAATVFCGIGAHLGSARSQNADRHILGYVRDVGRDPNDPTARIYQTSARQSFHTDSADVVGLLCLQDAKEGGDSLLVSAETIFNRMREERPDLLKLLFDSIATDRRGEVPEGMEPFMTIPPFSWHEDKLTVFYQRQYIDSAQRFEGAMRLTDAHIQALDMFDALANDPKLHISMRLQPGDMQFVYNHAMLHDRTGFVDWPDPDKQRQLFRLWLSLPGDRELPPVFAQRYGDLTVGSRGGIITDRTRLHAPLD